MKNTPATVQTQLDKVLAAFESGDVEGAMQKAITPRHPDDVRPSDSWSFRNRVLMALNGSSDARGFKQWKAAGRSVMKGQRAFHILAPCTRKIEDDVTGEDKVIVIGFRGVAVFDLEQTDGEPMPSFDYEPPAPPRLADVAARLGVEVKWNAGSRAPTAPARSTAAGSRCSRTARRRSGTSSRTLPTRGCRAASWPAARTRCRRPSPS